jgi:hypothetical protein
MSVSSVVIGNFYILDTIGMPNKTDTPLLVNANAVLSLSVAAQFLKPVGRRNAQIIKGGGIMQHNKLSLRDLLNVPRQFFGKTAEKYLFRFFAGKGLDHEE